MRARCTDRAYYQLNNTSNGKEQEIKLEVLLRLSNRGTYCSEAMIDSLSSQLNMVEFCMIEPAFLKLRLHGLLQAPYDTR